MSIFSDNITSAIRVKDVYEFVSIDIKDEYSDEIDLLNSTLFNTFEKKKILDYINQNNIGVDGKKIYERMNIDLFKILFKSQYYYLDSIFIGIIFVLLLSEGLDDKHLENVYNSLIRDFKYKQGSRVGVSISDEETTNVKFWIRNFKTKIRFTIKLNRRF